MALPKSLCDREQDKFCEDSAGKTSVRVCADTDPLPVTGEFVLAANGPMKVTGTTVGDVSAAYPATNQVGRASLSVRNIDKNDSIWIVNSTGISLAAAGVNIWEIGPDETLNTDFDDTNQIILVADSGNTINIQILEIKA